jgi:hypothetical protein
VEEAREAGTSPADELPGELADVQEVLQALLKTLTMTASEPEELAAVKRSKRGGFGGPRDTITRIAPVVITMANTPA